MEYIDRHIEKPIHLALRRGKSILLLGARQTGKTTLIGQIETDLSISLIKPDIRLLYERSPSLLTGEIESLAESLKKTPLVVLDEIQKVPELLDVVQDLIDRRVAQFILTGSSARKLRSGSKINLLPGRVVVFHLDPLTVTELMPRKIELMDLLLYGSLPVIIDVQNPQDKELDLASYVTTYLEEEVRAEALVRNVGNFSKFLMLAASESGNILNFRNLSQEIGVSHTTIISYYQILEDCLIAERIEPLLHTKTRRRLIQSPKYLFFDLGVRRLCAEEGKKLPLTYLGALFEQWVGLELKRYIRLLPEPIKIYFWRDASGPEVDFILEKDGIYIPIEVKWTDSPDLKHIKHLELFKKEYENTKEAYLVCQVQRKTKLANGIYALPWQQLNEIVSSI